MPGFIGFFARRGQMAEREGFEPPLVFGLARLSKPLRTRRCRLVARNNRFQSTNSAAEIIR
jgi:hypothetical protein